MVVGYIADPSRGSAQTTAAGMTRARCPGWPALSQLPPGPSPCILGRNCPTGSSVWSGPAYFYSARCIFCPLSEPYFTLPVPDFRSARQQQQDPHSRWLPRTSASHCIPSSSSPWWHTNDELQAHPRTCPGWQRSVCVLPSCLVRTPVTRDLTDSPLPPDARCPYA